MRSKNILPQFLRLDAIATLAGLTLLFGACARVADFRSSLTTTQPIKQFTGFVCQSNEPPAQPVMRLTKSQVRQVLLTFLTDILGSQQSANQVWSEAGADSYYQQIPDDYDPHLKRMDGSIGLPHVNHWSRLVFELAYRMTQSAWLNATLGNCQDPNSLSCRQNLFRRFEKIFATPITPVEELRFQATYDSVTTTTNDRYAAVVASGLLDPRVYLRAWLGQNQVSGDVYELSAYERADKLAFTLTGTLPDDLLLEAARNNSLLSQAVYTAQVDRLLALESNQYRHFARDFFESYLKLDRKSDPAFEFQNDPVLNAYLQQTYTVQVSLQERWQHSVTMLHSYLNYVINSARGSGGNVADFLQFGGNFAQTQDMAELTGDLWDGNTTSIPTSRNGRVGILGQPAMFMLYTTSYNPRLIMRGVGVFRDLACGLIETPANTSTPVGAVVPNPMTFVDNVRNVSEIPGTVCASCHKSRLNPFGFASAEFDMIGGYQPNHSLVNPTSPLMTPTFLTATPARTLVQLRLNSSDVFSTDNLEGMARYLAQGGYVDACISQTLVEYRERRAFIKESGDSCSAREVWRALRGPQGSFKAAFKALVTDPGFIRVKKPLRGM